MPPTFTAGSSVNVFSTACSSTSMTCAPDSRIVTTLPSCGTSCRSWAAVTGPGGIATPYPTPGSRAMSAFVSLAEDVGEQRVDGRLLVPLAGLLAGERLRPHQPARRLADHLVHRLAVRLEQPRRGASRPSASAGTLSWSSGISVRRVAGDLARSRRSGPAGPGRSRAPRPGRSAWSPTFSAFGHPVVAVAADDHVDPLDRLRPGACRRPDPRCERTTTSSAPSSRIFGR